MVGEDKPAWRTRFLAARATVPAAVRATEAATLAAQVAGLTGTVCAYRPIGDEPGGTEVLSALVTAGCEVLLPIVVRGRPLDWARYTGPDCLAPAPFGLLEPVGPRLGHLAVGTAATVLVPALGVDRHGVRLGYGGGYYDRSLPFAAPRAELLAVVRDSEVVDLLPREPHDVPMTGALTPSGRHSF